MTPDAFLRELRDLIQDDVGQRGLARDPIDNLLTARPDDFAAACHSIADHPAPHVGIVTGFMIPAVDPPTGETDGPLGALFLARAFAQFDIPCTLASDAAGFSALQSGIEYLGLTSNVRLTNLPLQLDVASFHREAGRLTHLIALERSGPSYNFDAIPPEHRDRNHTMRGRDITPLTSPAHCLFEGPRDNITIGIGDGGNEIGMGAVPYATICKNIPNGNLVACRVPTDHLIVAGVSNWGAYALAAGVMLLRDRFDPNLFDAELELKLLQHLVEAGPLVDGVTGQRTATVDGLTFADYVRPLVRIGEMLRDR